MIFLRVAIEPLFGPQMGSKLRTCGPQVHVDLEIIISVQINMISYAASCDLHNSSVKYETICPFKN